MPTTAQPARTRSRPPPKKADPRALRRRVKKRSVDLGPMVRATPDRNRICKEGERGGREGGERGSEQRRAAA